MSDIAIGVIVRPLTLIVLLLLAWSISWALYRFIPPGKIKDALYKRRELIPRTNRVER